MAQNSEERILNITVNYANALKSLTEYTSKIRELDMAEAELTKKRIAGTQSMREYYTALVANRAEAKQYQEAIQVINQKLIENVKAEQTKNNVLKTSQASLSSLKKEYDELGKAEQQSAKGKAMQEHLNLLREQVKNARADMTQFYQTIGVYDLAMKQTLDPLKARLAEVATAYNELGSADRNSAQGNALRDKMSELGREIQVVSEHGKGFQQSFMEIIGVNTGFIDKLSQSVGGITSLSTAFSLVSTSVSAFSKKLLVLAANPVVAILGVLSLAIMAISHAFKSSEEATGRMTVIMAPLNNALNFLNGILQTVIGFLLSVVEGAMALQNAISGLLERMPLIGGLFKKINDANSEAVEIAREKIEIEKQSRANEVQNAKDALEVSELRAKIKDTEKYTAEERLNMLRQANQREDDQAKRNLEIVERKFANMQREAGIVGQSKVSSEELASMEAELYNARKTYAEKTRELKESENDMIQQNAAAEKAAMEEKKRKAQEWAATVKEQKDKEREAVRAAEDAMLAVVKDGLDKQQQLVNLSYDRQIEDLRRKLETEKNLTKTAKEAINSQILALEEKRKQDLDKLSNDELMKNIATEQRKIELKLQMVKSGSEEEYNLKLQSLDKKREAELAQIGLDEEEKTLIKQKYDMEREQLQEERDQEIRDKQVEAIRVDYELRIQEAGDNETQALELKMEQKRAEIEAMQQLEDETDEEFKLRKLEKEEEYLDLKDELKDKEVEIETAKMQAVENLVSSVGSMLQAAGEHSKAAAIASKVVALAEIAINTGKAIAAGIASAQTVPFPGNIAAIATTIATILANVTTATKTVKGAKLAEGGLVTGPGSGTSDSIPAHLSNGESVMTAATTSMFSPILSAFNTMGGGVPIHVTSGNQAVGEEMLARAVAKGFTMAPAPVLSVEEFTTVSNRTRFIENMGDL